MAISGAVPVCEKTADILLERLVPRVEGLKIGPYTAGDDVDMGPLVTAAARDRVKRLVDSGVEQGAELALPRRTSTMPPSPHALPARGRPSPRLPTDLTTPPQPPPHPLPPPPPPHPPPPAPPPPPPTPPPPPPPPP